MDGSKSLWRYPGELDGLYWCNRVPLALLRPWESSVWRWPSDCSSKYAYPTASAVCVDHVAGSGSLRLVNESPWPLLGTAWKQLLYNCFSSAITFSVFLLPNYLVGLFFTWFAHFVLISQASSRISLGVTASSSTPVSLAMFLSPISSIWVSCFRSAF